MEVRVRRKRYSNVVKFYFTTTSHFALVTYFFHFHTVFLRCLFLWILPKTFKIIAIFSSEFFPFLIFEPMQRLNKKRVAHCFHMADDCGCRPVMSTRRLNKQILDNSVLISLAIFGNFHGYFRLIMQKKKRKLNAYKLTQFLSLLGDWADNLQWHGNTPLLLGKA